MQWGLLGPVLRSSSPRSHTAAPSFVHRPKPPRRTLRRPTGREAIALSSCSTVDHESGARRSDGSLAVAVAVYAHVNVHVYVHVVGLTNHGPPTDGARRCSPRGS